MLLETRIDEEFRHRCNLLAEIFDNYTEDPAESWIAGLENLEEMMRADLAWWLACGVAYEMIDSLTELGRDGVDYVWLKLLADIDFSPKTNFLFDYPDAEAMLIHAGVIEDPDDDVEHEK